MPKPTVEQVLAATDRAMKRDWEQFRLEYQLDRGNAEYFPAELRERVMIGFSNCFLHGFRNGVEYSLQAQKDIRRMSNE